MTVTSKSDISIIDKLSEAILEFFFGEKPQQEIIKKSPIKAKKVAKKIPKKKIVPKKATKKKVVKTKTPKKEKKKPVKKVVEEKPKEPEPEPKKTPAQMPVAWSKVTNYKVVKKSNNYFPPSF